ncbi:hypothetical protein evm_004804 [Chilo suppressalis]|nr:hypothetical protein evm_004804 [Chilo suppressalis]
MREEMFFSSGAQRGSAGCCRARGGRETSLTIRRSHLASPLCVVRAQLTSPLPSRHTNITHLRTAISTEPERRGDVSITQCYWLFKKHQLSARLVSALVESWPKSAMTRSTHDTIYQVQVRTWTFFPGPQVNDSLEPRSESQRHPLVEVGSEFSERFSPSEQYKNHLRTRRASDSSTWLCLRDWHNEDGSYTYGYEAADGSFKIETKSATGEVKGKYGYKDDTGKVRVIEYGANKFGFQPAGEGITVAPPTLVDESTREEGLRPQKSQIIKALLDNYWCRFWHHHHQPINVPTAGAQAFPMDGIGRLGHDPPRGPSADWWVLTTADAAGTNGLTCLPKHGGARDSKFLVTHPMTDHCESCLTSTTTQPNALTTCAIELLRFWHNYLNFKLI